MKLMGLIDEVSIRYLYRIAFLTNFAREPLLRRMQREFGIIRPEWTVLICVRQRDDVSPSDICEFTEQPRNTVSRAVASLVERGLVTRTEDHQDGRRMRLALTPAGKRLHDQIMPMFEAREARMLQALTAREKRVLDGLLQRLCHDVPRWLEGEQRADGERHEGSRQES